ncbi:MAG: spore germination protein [Peptococcaceae bacterium]|nr:spore germination protein [Peptococcaceae bacterium]
MDNLWDKIIGLFGEADPANNNQQPEIRMRGYKGNLAFLRETFGNAHDFCVREFRLGGDGHKVSVVYINHLADPSRIAEEVIMPMASFINMAESPQAKSRPPLAKQLLSSSDLKEITDLKQAETLLLDGWALILIEGLNPVLAVVAHASPGRAVSTAETETTIFGPKQAFVETSAINLALLRQKIKTSKLKVEAFTMGTKTTTKVLLIYIDEIAPDNMVDEARERLSQVEVDELMDSSYLESLMGFGSLSPFPQALYTERPDRVAGNLLEGRVAILVDGSPEALVLPVGFADLFQVAGDYYGRSLSVTLVRALRVLAFFLATTLPALYAALVSFNYEILPTDLTIPVASFRTGIPFPPAIEVFLMLLIVDILQEGATRLPTKVGQTVGVVGGFVLGQAIIQAGLVSPLLLIAIAISLIGSFAMPNYRVIGLVRILRYALLLGGSVLSGVGIMAVWVAIIIHMASIEVLGVPYLRPLAPLRMASMGDFIYRRPYINKPTGSKDNEQGT